MSHVSTTRDGQILTIALNRPEKMNAITRAMYADLTQALQEAAGDFGVRAVIVTCHGDHFTAGNDIMDFMNNPPTAEDSDVARFLGALLNFPKPLIAAVKGNAVGVGTTMLLHCDIVISDESARFSMPFVSLGLVPEAGSTYLFPQLVGHQRAAKVWFTGEPFSATEAREMGLVIEISPEPQERANAIAKKIAEQPPQAVINTKALMKARLHDPVAAVMRAEFEIFAMALQSEEAAEAFMKFMSKRSAT